MELVPTFNSFLKDLDEVNNIYYYKTIDAVVFK
jgi:hypothetical protein